MYSFRVQYLAYDLVIVKVVNYMKECKNREVLVRIILEIYLYKW